jgi:hypothetical protein
MIKIPNTNNKVTYRFTDIFEIIDQYHVTVSYNDDNNNNYDDDNSDSRSGDEENSVVSRPKPKKIR